MSAIPASRVNYFDRQYLRLAELTDEQSYHLQLRRRHNLSHHSWGIVVGLEILRQDDGQPVVRPGLAVDGYGRELLLLDRRVVGREMFDRFGTSRLDLWLEYRLELADDRSAPVECGASDPNRRYRATERAEIVATRGGARPDPRRPPGVPATALEEPLLATPDDPRCRWPVYLGRIVMEIPASGVPAFQIDTADRVYVGLNAELIDHPGNASRIELGRRPVHPDVKQIGADEFHYAADSTRDFAVFVPDAESAELQPTLAIYGTATQIRGAAEVHGNLVLDGASLQFPDPSAGEMPATDGHPAIYRASTSAGDELRIDVGNLGNADRALVIGMTKDGKFQPAIEVHFAGLAGGPVKPLVTVHGELHIEGTIKSADIRSRTVTADVAALVSGMVQTAMVSN
jgi:hypothetical protein